MHHCLYISEVLDLIFKFVKHSDDHSHLGPHVGKKTLASLARTCRLFSPSALDALWHDLYSFYPLIKVFPSATSFVDDAQWLNFRAYAKRVKTFRGREARVPMRVKQEFVSSLQHCPKHYFPLLPNVTELDWSELEYEAIEDSGISLLKYFAGPAVATVTLSLTRWLAYSSADLADLVDLPTLCPNVTSFAAIVDFSWEYDPSQEVGRMVIQWPRLRTLETCAIAQPVMDELFSRRTLESLHVDYHNSSPTYIGRIPDMVREFTFGADNSSLCKRFLETVHANPTKFRLLIGTNDEKEEETGIEETFHLLPRRLDTSRLLSLSIQPRWSIVGIPMWHTLMLRESLVSALVEFKALHELDLDLLCMAQMTDADYTRLAGSLVHLRTLKLGTSNPTTRRPVASIGAVIAVLRHCAHLEVLHIVFNGSIPIPGGRAAQDDKTAYSEKSLDQGWGVSNKFITKLHVGCSPVEEATVNAIASCFKSIMPRLAQIEYKYWDEEWRLVQNALESY